ncbi:hypothetical protein PC120_g12136 [Phytophthora cactorum]|nr:hypothetical protein PC120_g12136 [Phytophthora cactorum]
MEMICGLSADASRLSAAIAIFKTKTTLKKTLVKHGEMEIAILFFCSKSRRCDPRREVDVGAGVLLLTKFRAQHVEVALLQQLLKIQGVLVVKTAASLVCWM